MKAQHVTARLVLANPEALRSQILELALDQHEVFVLEASVYRLLKAHDFIASPAYIVIKAAAAFKDKTTAPNQLWQTDITGWDWG